MLDLKGRGLKFNSQRLGTKRSMSTLVITSSSLHEVTYLCLPALHLLLKRVGTYRSHWVLGDSLFFHVIFFACEQILSNCSPVTCLMSAYFIDWVIEPVDSRGTDLHTPPCFCCKLGLCQMFSGLPACRLLPVMMAMNCKPPVNSSLYKLPWSWSLRSN